MKKIFVVAVACMVFATSSFSQQRSAIPDEALDGMLAKFREIQVKRAAEKEMEKILEQAIDEMMVKLKTWIANNEKEEAQFKKNYQPGYNHKPGEMNLFPIWEEIPAPVPSLPEAVQTNFDKYQNYIDKVEMMKKQLGDMEQQHLGQQRTDQASMMQDAKNMTNKNAVVMQMGGVDAVMNMSKAERKAAAKKIQPGAMPNTAAYSGVPDEGMNAMMQRLMTDKEYQQKYNKMTEAQKEAELKKYMSNKTVKRDDAAFEQSMRERNETNNSAAIQLLLGKCLQQMQQAAVPYSEGTKLANDFYYGLYAGIENWYKKQYDALPLQVMGEGHIKVGLSQLDKFKAAVLYRLHKKEAATRTILWTSLKARTKIAFGEFNDFIGAYPWGKSKNANVLDGSYTEPQVAKAVVSLYDEMIRLTKEAEALSRRHKGQQEQYNLIVNNLSK
ncbi:hypothetical protein [Terrimonas alba]|uniref:hypothetical protein n=1 Tax=Terrimonas alba TaxID=3349636 RepID=UPI0035F4107C